MGILASPLAAEDPMLLGLRGALSALAPVPEETARGAHAAADALLAPYLKKQGENHLCQMKASPAGTWMELQGLKIQGVSAQAVSQADRANGIQEKLLVLLDCDMYRTRKSGETVWSPWVNGIPILFPPAIHVEHGTNGAWTASSTNRQFFNPIGNPRPPANPQAAAKQQAVANPGTAGLPPGMSRAGSGTTPPPAKSIPPTPNPAAPILKCLPNHSRPRPRGRGVLGASSFNSACCLHPRGGKSFCSQKNQKPPLIKTK